MRFYSVIIIILCITASAISCGRSAEEEQRINQAERDSLRRLDSLALKVGVLPTEECLPIVVAEKLRLFDTLNVSVHLRHYHALSECRIALNNKLVEGAVIDTMLAAIMDSVVYSSMRLPMTWKLLTAKKARISRLDQLADKMIAADSHGCSHALAQQVNDTLKVKKKQAFIIQVEDIRVRTQMLTTGNVDAALLPEPFAAQAKREGAREIPLRNINAGVVAFRKKGMKDEYRKKQEKLFIKAIQIANDSIHRYGKDKYKNLIAW